VYVAGLERVEVATALTENVQMKLGAVSTTITVTETPGAELQTMNSTVGATIEHQELLQLPNTSRDATTFATLQPSTNINGNTAGAVVDLAKRQGPEMAACFLALLTPAVVPTGRMLVPRARIDDRELRRGRERDRSRGLVAHIDEQRFVLVAVDGRELIEEAEAIGWYEQRMAVETDAEARAIMANSQKEEFKHFGMDLEFLLRRKPEWRTELKEILFTSGDIVDRGEAAEKKID